MKMTTQRGKIKAPRTKFGGAVSFETSWETLATAMSKIQEHESSPLSFELLYRTSYQLVISKMSSQLYEAVKAHISAHLGRVQSSFDPYVVVAPNDLSLAPEYLVRLNKQWGDHQTCTKMISDVMMYLDRVYCLDTGSSPPKLADLGLHLFRDHVIGEEAFSTYLYKVLVHEIQREREGEMVDKLVVKSILSMLDSLPQSRHNKESVLVHCFSDQLVAATTKYYAQAARDLLDSNKDPVVYVTKVSLWLQDEERRSKFYALESPSYSPLVGDLTLKLVSEKLPEVMTLPGAEMRKWWQAKKYDELKTLYHLITKGFPQRALLHHLLKEQITSEGRELNEASVASVETARKEKKSNTAIHTTLAQKWVTDVLTMRDEFAEITAKCFNNDVEVVKSVDEAFVTFVNQHARVAEYLSLYIDNLMKKALKGKSDEEVSAILDSTVACFNFISNKDTFESYYKAHLGKRLLMSKSVSDDAERQLISKLKMAAGGAFTSKLEGMFKDMNTSADEMEAFRKRRAAILADSDPMASKPVEISVSLLSRNYWPFSISQGSHSIIHCAEAEAAKAQFEQYYHKEHSGRKLDWVPNLGTADIRIRFKKKMHEVNVPTAVMPILMLFQDVGDAGITFGRIQAETDIPLPELKRHLQSVSVAPKTRLLKKVPMSKDVAETDEFFFNDNFESTMTKIRVLAISNVTRAESDAERDNTLQQIDKSRQGEIDAAVVRVMKSRKTLTHNNLVGEVTKQLASRFKPPIPTIKYCIESLLEREYLRRDDNDTTLFHYEA